MVVDKRDLDVADASAPYLFSDVNFILGANTCTSLSPQGCNGPLKPSTNYA
ncbi:unnamed protein product [Protopolystoma xenopodis]|uniref:Uncharacterized protein n=1 Tax=Protopolystoma xenopodis TaxID=117903 RepID=A0A3S5C0Q9_9PLAT|nr:unnamed protein product [Protopolystoma xenopodis]